MSPFEFLDYRDWIREYVEARKTATAQLSFGVLAEKTGIQRTFLSRVLKKETELSTDQVYKICEFFQLTEEKTHYLLLLTEMIRTQIPNRRKQLLEEVERQRKKYFDTSTYVDVPNMNIESGALAAYFLDPYVQLVHIFLGIKDYSRTPQLLEKILKIDKLYLEQILAKLISLDLVVKDRSQYKVIRNVFHLPKESPLCKPYLISQRSLMLGHLQRLNNDSLTYSFSATFSANEHMRNEIHTQFLLFLKEVQALCAEVQADNVYQIHFDLVPWK
jgi:uncharacterized protein (TIGR02147 family)